MNRTMQWAYASYWDRVKQNYVFETVHISRYAEKIEAREGSEIKLLSLQCAFRDCQANLIAIKKPELHYGRQKFAKHSRGGEHGECPFSNGGSAHDETIERGNNFISFTREEKCRKFLHFPRLNFVRAPFATDQKYTDRMFEQLGRGKLAPPYYKIDKLKQMVPLIEDKPFEKTKFWSDVSIMAGIWGREKQIPWSSFYMPEYPLSIYDHAKQYTKQSLLFNVTPLAGSFQEIRLGKDYLKAVVCQPVELPEKEGAPNFIQPVIVGRFNELSAGPHLVLTPPRLSIHGQKPAVKSAVGGEIIYLLAEPRNIAELEPVMPEALAFS